MASKSTIVINTLQPPILDVENTPLDDVDYKITDPVIEFNLLDLHCWSLEKSLDQGDEVQIWESNLPKYVVPHTHQCPEVIRMCQAHYSLDQRDMFDANKDVLSTITAKSINLMLQLKPDPNVVPLSIEALTKIYIELDFPKRF